MSNSIKYYVASKVKHAPMWLRLRDRGVPIISTWINEAGEGQTGSYCELSTRCLSEIAQVDALVLYAQANETLKGALIEVGAALALGKQVRAFGVFNGVNLSRMFVMHPLWRGVPNLESAFCEAFASHE